MTRKRIAHISDEHIIRSPKPGIHCTLAQILEFARKSPNSVCSVFGKLLPAALPCLDRLEEAGTLSRCFHIQGAEQKFPPRHALYWKIEEPSHRIQRWNGTVESAAYGISVGTKTFISLFYQL